MLCITIGGLAVFRDAGREVFWNQCYTETHLPIQFFTLAKGMFRDQTIPIAFPIELQDVLGQLAAICDCLDMDQSF